MGLRYSHFVNGDGTENVTLFHDGEMYPATSDHPNWAGILEKLKAADESVVDLFDTSKVVAKRFEQLSDRIKVANGTIYFDGDPVNSVLTKQILRFVDEGVEDWRPLVEFYERMAINPNQESVEQLYRWLNAHDFTINEDGMILGYKGVQTNSEGNYESVNTGEAVVDGQEYNGHIPNYIGAVVEMPRSKVTFDPNQGCSFGLHVGTWNYARGWARNGVVLKVLVDPRDVVSVPNDSYGQKLRTCKYKVLDVLTDEMSTVVEYDEDYDDDYEEDHSYSDDYCEYCGYAPCDY